MSDENWTVLIDEEIPSVKGAGEDVERRMVECLERENWEAADVFAVRLAFEEAIVNAIKHGNQHDDTKSVRVVCKTSSDRVRIEIADQGGGFQLEAVPDPTDDDRLDVPSGRGITLMKAFMCVVEYNESGNRVTMEKQRGGSNDDDDE